MNGNNPSTAHRLAVDQALLPSIPTFEREWTVGEWIASTVSRAFDIAIASVALVVCAPVMLLVAIIVRLDSPGPALFRQRRVGLNGRLFWFYKFRTLYVDAKERFPELYAYNYSPSQVLTLKFKVEDDPRISRAGRWLRRSTLDELPNFWNLLKGDIGLVGPRPEIPDMLRHYTPDQLVKFSVRPGITGLAQTHGRGDLPFQRTIAYDLEYVRNKSVWLDIKIILRTIWMMVRLRLDGAY